MKKILSILLVLAMATSCIFMFASCGGGGKPNSDPEKAKEALEDADYTVTTSKAMFAGVEGLEDVVMAYKTDVDLDDIKDPEDLEDIKMEVVMILYFEDEDAAKDAFKDIKGEMADGLAEQYGVDDFECKQSGKMVWVGTPAAIKAAK